MDLQRDVVDVRPFLSMMDESCSLRRLSFLHPRTGALGFFFLLLVTLFACGGIDALGNEGSITRSTSASRYAKGSAGRASSWILLQAGIITSPPPSVPPPRSLKEGHSASVSVVSDSASPQPAGSSIEGSASLNESATDGAAALASAAAASDPSDFPLAAASNSPPSASSSTAHDQAFSVIGKNRSAHDPVSGAGSAPASPSADTSTSFASPSPSPSPSPSLSASASASQPGELTVHNPFLFLNGGGRAVLSNAVESPFLPSSNDSWWCSSTYRNLVFPPNRTVCYYIYDERCTHDNKIRDWRLSFGKTNLSVNRQGFQSGGAEQFLGFWWRASLSSSHSGQSKGDYYMRAATAENLSMTFVSGLDVIKGGRNLVMASSDGLPGGSPSSLNSKITVMSTNYGNRSSIPLRVVRRADSLTFNRAKTRLYLSDTSTPVRILSTDVSDPYYSEMPISGEERWKVVGIFSPPTSSSSGHEVNISDVAFSANSIGANDSCLYFLDRINHRVWGIDLLSASSSSDVMLTAGTGTRGSANGDGFHASFDSLRDVVTTSDGCNVFVSEGGRFNGSIRWLKLDWPCSTARSVETVVSYPGRSLWGLAVQEFESRLLLYVGANDGRLFVLEIDRSRLYVCAPNQVASPRLEDTHNALLNTSCSPTPHVQFFATKTSGRLVLFIVVPLGALSMIGLCAYLILRCCEARRRRAHQQQYSISKSLTSSVLNHTGTSL